MQQLGAYIVSVTAAAMISGILLSLIKSGPMRALLRLVCGVVLILTALRPLTNTSGSDFNLSRFDYRQEGEAAAALGLEVAMEHREMIITEQLEAYILDKAYAAGADISVELRLDEEGIPRSVWLTGTWTPQARQDIAVLLTEELGITKEDQQWIGQN